MNEEIDLEEFAPWLAGLITLVGLTLRMLLLGTKGMWLDETFSVWLASHSVADMLQWIVRIDQHPPLYYLFLHYWIVLSGDTPYYVRLLSVLFGAGAIPIIYLIGSRMSGPVVGLAAAAFLAFSPFHIYFAQETRMYTLLTFNAAVAIYALVRLLTDPRAARPIGSQLRERLRARRAPAAVEPASKTEFSYRDEAGKHTGWRGWLNRRRGASIRAIETDLAWVVFVVFSAATLLTHNTSVLLPIATNIFVLGLMLLQRRQRPESQPAFRAPSLANWVKAQVVIFLLWSPWLLPFIRQAGAVDRRFWIPEPTWDAVVQLFRSFLNASAPLPAGLGAAVWGLYATVFVLGVFYYRRRLSQLVMLGALFAVPVLGELIVSLRRPIFYDRTLIWTTMPLFLLLAAGIAQLRFRLLIILVLGTLGTINVFSASDYLRFYQKEDWSTAAGYVANFAEKDDLVLFNSNFVEIPFDYYFRDYERLYAIHVEKQGVPQDLFATGSLEPEMTTGDVPELTALVRGRDRVWLVYSHDSYTDPLGLVPQTLASQMRLARQRDFHGGQVQLYISP